MADEIAFGNLFILRFQPSSNSAWMDGDFVSHDLEIRCGVPDRGLIGRHSVSGGEREGMFTSELGG